MLSEAVKPYDRLKEHIREATFPKQVELMYNQVVTDVPKFIASHISYLDANPGKRIYKPYYDRLVLLLKHKNHE